MLETRSVVIALFIFIVCYFIFGRKYNRYLRESYNYNLFGLPAIIAILGPAIQSLMAWAGPAVDVEPGVSSILLKMLLFATPGVVIATIVCLVKTRNGIIVLVNIPILYAASIILGGSIAVAVMAIIVFVVILLAAGGLIGGAVRGGAGAAKGGMTCPHCGAGLSQGMTCPCGRSYGAWGYDTPRAADDFPKSSL